MSECITTSVKLEQPRKVNDSIFVTVAGSEMLNKLEQP